MKKTFSVKKAGALATGLRTSGCFLSWKSCRGRIVVCGYKPARGPAVRAVAALISGPEIDS